MADRYWVGGSGDWEDDDNHWSDTSGGSPMDGNLPTSTDDVYFDSNSGLSSGLVTTSADSFCNNLSCSVANTWELQTSSPLYIYGSAIFETGMTNSGSISFQGSAITFYSGQDCTELTTNFESTATFDSGGNVFQEVAIAGASASVTLTNDLVITNSITIYGGASIDADSYDVDFVHMTVTDFSSVFFGSGTWTCHGGNTSLIGLGGGDAGTSTIKMVQDSVSNIYFSASSAITYYNLWLTGSGSGNIVVSAPSFELNELKIDGASKSILFEDGITVSLDSLVAVGDVSTTYTITSTSSTDSFNLSKLSGLVEVDYLDISWSNATGGATWSAGENSIDSGNNSGWVFGTPGTFEDDSRNALIAGHYTLYDSRSALITGGEGLIGSRSALMVGYDLGDSVRGAIITGTNTIWQTTPKGSSPDWTQTPRTTSEWTRGSRPSATWTKTPKP